MDSSTIGKRSQDPKSGKFVSKSDEIKLVPKNIKLTNQCLEDIKQSLKPGETISSFIRDAIAHYLDFLKSMK